VIGDRVLIGSGSMLVAPVAVSDDVLIGAGSVVTTNLPTGTKLVQKRRSR
jgi:bifunctional UDP-N-acetylglucosamine pyrophosphorylase/glucosamine-1-phosphate N-acetyltransferase